MSLHQYYNEGINIREDSINNYKYLFKFDKHPNLNEALSQMFKSTNLNSNQVNDLINDILFKCKERIDNKWHEIKKKYSNITKDEAYIICSYTCEAKDKKYNPYRLLNENIVSENKQKGLKNVNKYFYILLSALRKLTIYHPKENQSLFRCIKNKINLEKDIYNDKLVSYQKGNTKIFWGFTSTSPSFQLSLNFLKNNNYGRGTIFYLGGYLWGYDITLFNYYNETEILLEPERKFIIKDIKINYDDIIYCYCDMLESEPILGNNLFQNENNINNLDYERIEKYIVKIEKEIDDDYYDELGFGFLCNIPSKKIRALITYESIINEDFLSNEKKVILYIENERKEINISSPKYKNILKDLNITIIEINNEDDIDIENFMEIEENKDSKDYEEEDIIYIQFNENKEIKYYKDTLIINTDKEYFLKSDKPLTKGLIISNNNLKLIGTINNKIIPMNILIDNINFIKAKFEVENTSKEIRILNNSYEGFNFEIEKTIKIIIDGQIKSYIYEYKFNKKGINVVYYIAIDIIHELSFMFKDCYSLKEIDLSSFNTNNVTQMKHLFFGCALLKEINLSFFNTKSVKNMNSMFEGCTSLEVLNLSSFETQNVNFMSLMFSGCTSLKQLDLSSFNTQNVNDMKGMFKGCSSLKELNIFSFNTQNVTDMEEMFSGCTSLKQLDLYSFNTEKVRNMSNMFKECSSLEYLNLLNFNADNKPDISNMFIDIGKSCKLDCNDNKIIEKFEEGKGCQFCYYNCFIF